MKVDIYRNLHKNCWSVRSRESHNYGRVVAHASSLILDDAKFVVSQAGRNRVLKEKKKNVHAVVRGNLLYTNYKSFDNSKQDVWFKYRTPIKNNYMMRCVTYHPYKKSTFFWVDTKEPVHYSKSVIFVEDMKVYAS
tara:strand:+ start:367 stop:774 length:408 start_codon:yes stop_codon:yes gene_type:complete